MALSGQNLVADAGHVEVGNEYIRLQPNGEFTSVKDIGDLLIAQTARQSSRLYLRDVATIRRGYVDPPKAIMHFNGRPAIGIGISTVLGGNVVTMGEAVDKRLEELIAERTGSVDRSPTVMCRSWQAAAGTPTRKRRA